LIWWGSYYFTHISPDRYEFTVQIYADENVSYTVMAPCPIYQNNRSPLFFVYQLKHNGCGYVWTAIDNMTNENYLYIVRKGNIRGEYVADGKILDFTLSNTNLTFYNMTNGDTVERVVVFLDTVAENQKIYFEMKLHYVLNNEIRTVILSHILIREKIM
jgi:hypothetical protein